ncbi:MAG TPA: translation elongation factor Ts [Candidatus Saccharimonadia bacterium]|nr:translation elongation factor Ts [Candidatus Saccharimonadia bacterium]
MAVDIEQVKRLKDLTGVGLTDAKKALEEAGGDFDKALAAMRKKGLTKAEKRGEREAREGRIGTYNHDGRIGVLVEVNCETDFIAKGEIFNELVKDLAMHIAAAAPQYVSADEVPEADKAKIREEFAEKAKSDGKPAGMVNKIVDGQLQKYFAERCLLDQPFVKNPDITVADHVKENAARMNENVVVRRFARLALGEIS